LIPLALPICVEIPAGNRTVNPLRPRFHIVDFLKFTALCGVFLALFAWSRVDLAMGANWPWSVLCPLGVAVVCALTFLRPRVVSLRCELCGRSYFPTRTRAPGELCPTCRTAKLPQEQRRRLAILGFVIITILLLLSSFVLLWPFSGLIDAQLGSTAYTIMAICLAVVMVALFVAAMIVRFLIGQARMSRPWHALSVARASARQVGLEIDFGSVTVHVFGQVDPTLMLKGQMETCKKRFESLLGQSLEDDRPLRIFVFAKRNAFEAFLRKALLFPGNMDGMYIPWSTATIAITTEVPSYRLTSTDKVVRCLLSYFFLYTYVKRPTPLWLQMGIALHLACGGEASELARLNRKMLAASSRGTLLGTTDLFHAEPRAMIKLVRDWQQHDNFTRYTQFASQSWSLVEFLRGHDEAGQRFRSLLENLGPQASLEELLQQQFGYGFDTLLDHWRQWIARRGIGYHDPPEPEIRDILVEGTIPAALALDASPLDQIQAIREMGKAGYVLGADALIKLLGEDDEALREEVVWSLEAISGLALGHDRAQWQRWFDGLAA
jgi:hypothetical protein